MNPRSVRSDTDVGGRGRRGDQWLSRVRKHRKLVFTKRYFSRFASVGKANLGSIRFRRMKGGAKGWSMPRRNRNKHRIRDSAENVTRPRPQSIVHPEKTVFSRFVGCRWLVNQPTDGNRGWYYILSLSGRRGNLGCTTKNGRLSSLYQMKVIGWWLNAVWWKWCVCFDNDTVMIVSLSSLKISGHSERCAEKFGIGMYQCRCVYWNTDTEHTDTGFTDDTDTPTMISLNALRALTLITLRTLMHWHTDTDITESDALRVLTLITLRTLMHWHWYHWIHWEHWHWLHWEHWCTDTDVTDCTDTPINRCGLLKYSFIPLIRVSAVSASPSQYFSVPVHQGISVLSVSALSGFSDISVSVPASSVWSVSVLSVRSVRSVSVHQCRQWSRCRCSQFSVYRHWYIPSLAEGGREGYRRLIDRKRQIQRRSIPERLNSKFMGKDDWLFEERTISVRSEYWLRRTTWEKLKYSLDWR